MSLLDRRHDLRANGKRSSRGRNGSRLGDSRGVPVSDATAGASLAEEDMAILRAGLVLVLFQVLDQLVAALEQVVIALLPTEDEDAERFSSLVAHQSAGPS